MGASFALAFWSYIPLYTLPINIGAHLLKLPIEVCPRHQRPRRSNELRNETSRREPLWRTRCLVKNTGYTNPGSHIGLFHTSGESEPD